MAKKKKSKWLYEFTINREVEKERKTKSTNDEGKKIEITEKYTEPTAVNFYLKKPTRKLYDDAELFYGVKMSEGIKAGLLTRNLLAKRYEDDGGAFSEVEKKRYSELYLEIYNKEGEFQKLQLNLDNKSQDLKEKLSQDLVEEISALRRELTDIENSQSNIFDQTAENRAKNQTIMWWVLTLSHWKEYDHNEIAPFFGTGSHEEKLEQYDTYEESDDDFHLETIKKLAYFISFWYMGRATNEDDFKAVEELYTAQNEEELEELEDLGEAPEETSEEAKEEPKVEEAVEKPKKKPTKTKKKRGRPKAKAVEKEEPKEEKKVVVAEEATEEAVEEQPAVKEAVAETETDISPEN